LQFPAEDGDSVLSIAAELPGGAPSLKPEERSRDELVQDFTLMALVRDGTGRIVHKSSRRYALSWPKAKAGDVRQGRILFERDAVLPPGRYTVEAVAYDAQAGTAGVDRVAVTAPETTGGARRVSSLMLVGHAEKRALAEDGPLRYQGLLLYPSFGEPVSVGAGKPLAFLFTLRPGDRPPPEAKVDLLNGTGTVRRADVPLPPPDATGQVRVVSGLPIAGIAPGRYTLRLTLTDGQSLEARTAEVTLGP
jgi:hypothetical protein